MARRFVTLVPWRVGVLLALLPLAFTGKAFLRGDLYGPSDLYYSHDPWHGVAAENGVTGVANPILSDLAFANIPWRAAVREALVNGRLPLWNRFVLAGNPLLATAQASVFHPATWLAIFLPLAQSWTFSCAFTIFLALLAGYLFFREICSSDVAALVGAVGWGFSTYVLFWDGWAVGPSVSTFPLLILGLRRLARGPASGRGVLITTAALALSFHGGHPETFFHGLAAGGVYFLWEIFPRDRRQRARRAVTGLLGSGLLAFGLAAPVLLPLLEALPHSAEYAARIAALEAGRPRQSVPAAEAARRLRPAFLPFAHGIYGRSPVQDRRQDGSGMPLGYAGAVLFPLAAVGAFGRRPRERTVFAGFFLVGLAYGASTPILLDATSRLPGFSLALNYRLVFLASLGIAGLAALGADRLVERRSASRDLAIASGAVLAILALFFVVSRGVFRDRGLPPEFVNRSFAAEALPVFLLGIAAAAGGKRERAVIAAAAILLVAQRSVEMSGVYPTLPARSLSPALPALASLPQASHPYRVVAVGDDFRPNGAALSGREDVRGYESLVLRRFEETYPLWCRRQFASHNRVDDLARPFLAFLNARYAVGGPVRAAPTGWKVLARDRAASTFENPRALPRAFVPRTIRVEADARRRLAEMSVAGDFSQTSWVDGAPSRGMANGAGTLQVREVGSDLVIDADLRERALVATSVPDWPGWTARSGGRAVALATVNHAFVGFWLPPGRHQVRLHYLPESFRFGVALAAIAVLAGVLLGLARRRRAIP
jgi:membrane protein YfhO